MSQQKNEFFALVEKKKADLWEVKANYLQEKQEVYFKRALLAVAQDKNLLALSKTKPGAQSLFMCISRSIQMGLQIGGQIPQAYLVPMKDTATLIPTAEGYKFIALTDPPVLKSFIVRAVCEGEKFSLNYVTGEVDHSMDFKTKKGQLIGVYCLITDLKDNKLSEFMSREDIEKIRDTHSRAWKAYLNKKISADKCPWLNDFEMMALKTATKRFLKPYAALKEGLAMALAVENEGDVKPDTRPIESRAESILDDAIEVDATVEKPAEEEKPKEEKPAENKNSNPKDLF
jgi:phage RecT family recombinase